MTETLNCGCARSAHRTGRVVARVLGAVGLLCATGMFPGARPAGAETVPAAGVVTLVPGAGTTLWVDGRPYSGQVTVARDGAGLAVVNRVPFEDYVAGIAEMPSTWPAAALQAQAVAARTYALWTVLTQRPGPGGAQICASDYCQVYSGLAKTEGPDGGNWLAAVRATTGQVLTYDGRIIEAVYGSSDGGQTLSGGVPWLPSVPDPDDALAPEHQWSWSRPIADFEALLGVPAGQQLVSLVSSPSAITETLRAAGGAAATRTLSPSTFHRLLNAGLAAPAGLDLPLPSWRYSVSTYGTAVRIAGYGDGQGMGMSQYGALGKADRGYSAAQILGTYYRGAVLERLPATEAPAAISVALVDPAAQALIQASGPVQLRAADGAPIAATTAPASWQARPDGSGVELQPVPGAPPGIPPPGSESAPPAPPTAPPPGAVGAPATAVAPPARTTSATPPAVAPPTAAPPASGAPHPVAAAYQRPAPPGGRPTGWAALALIALLVVCAAFTRMVRRTRMLTASSVPRPAGSHYRVRSRRRPPTTRG